MISLQGYSDSPEYQAMVEWTAFCDGYDPDKTILKQVGNGPTGLESRYQMYSAYTREMADALDEIVQRHGLKLHTELWDILSREDLFRQAGGAFLSEDHRAYSAYMYEDGTFHYDGDWLRPSGEILEYQFQNCRKGCFTEISLNIGQVEEYAQWEYQTSCGVTVTLALSGHKGLIIADLGSAFVTANVLAGSDEWSGGMTREEMEGLADSIDCSVLQNSGTPDVPAAVGDYTVCTRIPGQEVERFAAEVRQLILDQDWDSLADRLVYPILVNGESLYMDSEEFRKDGTLLDVLLGGEAFRAALEQEDCHEMFCNYQGIMLGDGQVWIGETLEQDGTSQGLKVFVLQGDVAEPEPQGPAAAPEAYRQTLENLLGNYQLPGGIVCNIQGDMAQNRFALADVDGDGRQELLLQYNTGCMAEQAEYVLDWWGESDETGVKLLTELLEYPMLTFYDNGVIKAGWSHNQGLAGEHFWPYTLYRYDAPQDQYLMVAQVDAWDKSFAPKNYQGEPFPDEADLSGSGIVYFIMEDGYDDTRPVDAEEYEQWLNQWLEGAEELTIPYQPLTEENIRQLGK